MSDPEKPFSWVFECARFNARCGSYTAPHGVQVFVSKFAPPEQFRVAQWHKDSPVHVSNCLQDPVQGVTYRIEGGNHVTRITSFELEKLIRDKLLVKA